MKTIIDAVNELRGDLDSITTMGLTASIVYSKAFGFSGYWEVNGTALSGTCWQFVCTSQEFNAMVAEMSEGFEEYKREYEMNKVETVTVDGMVYQLNELYVMHNGNENDQQVHGLCEVSESGNFIDENGSHWAFAVNTIKLGAITPAPVELVHGKAYMFDYSDEGSAAGFYDKEKDSFRILYINMNSEYCTNIIPLVPEVK